MQPRQCHLCQCISRTVLKELTNCCYQQLIKPLALPLRSCDLWDQKPEPGLWQFNGGRCDPVFVDKQAEPIDLGAAHR
ncbi:uncharacterized protein PHALS_14318 [Plasmopara halstedii]|uniref:Uncharacterized protein n=1 Tax=Plasmopara halstedii TaxID=4781 RepID=A0A0P1ARC1_PLAHL|nr:uncharacterized protein PHALS_14318 [Plasmopara halstedii]CEG44048.1 hypothetical protein PHALS_14318 [Plasmopara halstedii]|eukprot:XP_024580417.1 hypothetical protein PHALS_14318 [Plasmopara halstedii]